MEKNHWNGEIVTFRQERYAQMKWVDVGEPYAQMTWVEVGGCQCSQCAKHLDLGQCLRHHGRSEWINIGGIN